MQDAGYEALPARRVLEAVDLLSEFKVEVDLLIVDPALPGVADLIGDPRRSQPHLKIISCVEAEVPTFILPGVDAPLPKPRSVDETTRLKWLETIQILLECDSTRQ